MAARLFQGLILQMKDTVDRTFGVMDATGTIVACTELPRIGEIREDVAAELSYTNNLIVCDHFTYKPVLGQSSRFEYAVFVKGDDEVAKNICGIVAVAIGSIRSLYDEKHDKFTFIKNIILDNILPGDIYIKSRELHFGSDVPRVVFFVRQMSNQDIAAIDVIANLYPDKQKDFVININETDIVLVKEVRPNVDAKELNRIAKSIEDALNSELMISSAIGIGTVVGQLKDIAKSFKEAQVAIDVGRVFDSEKSIISFENLGVGRLIYQLPTTLCEMFLSEVFRKESIDSLDNETLFTIQKFFENSLNVSETSRKLFVHRNTLVYRLEKIKKITGLDLREFDHAIVFKVALMVKKYLVSRENKS
ncbi:MAG: helix-turn-helix domain-containing protein [Clostridiales bacterium]|nr:helix-turn-helix domain-containing protein [Clostridiales bacterium]